MLKGRQARRQPAESALLGARLLRRKFLIQPELEKILARLTGLPLQRLEDPAGTLLDFDSIQVVDDWLNSRQGHGAP